MATEIKPLPYSPELTADQKLSQDFQKLLVLKDKVDHDMLFHRSILPSQREIKKKMQLLHSHEEVKIDFKSAVERNESKQEDDEGPEGFKICFRLSSAYSAIRSQERQLSRPQLMLQRKLYIRPVPVDRAEGARTATNEKVCGRKRTQSTISVGSRQTSKIKDGQGWPSMRDSGDGKNHFQRDFLKQKSLTYHGKTSRLQSTSLSSTRASPSLQRSSECSGMGSKKASDSLADTKSETESKMSMDLLQSEVSSYAGDTFSESTDSWKKYGTDSGSQRGSVPSRMGSLDWSPTKSPSTALQMWQLKQKVKSCEGEENEEDNERQSSFKECKYIYRLCNCKALSDVKPLFRHQQHKVMIMIMILYFNLMMQMTLPSNGAL